MPDAKSSLRRVTPRPVSEKANECTSLDQHLTLIWPLSANQRRHGDKRAPTEADALLDNERPATTYSGLGSQYPAIGRSASCRETLQHIPHRRVIPLASTGR